MRRIGGWLAGMAIVGALVAGPVQARVISSRGVVALAPSQLFEGGPVIAGERVVYGVEHKRAINLFGAALAGGPVAQLPSLRTPLPILGFTLVGDSQALGAAVVLDTGNDNGRDELFAGPVGTAPRPQHGSFSLYLGNPPSGFFAAGSDIFAVQGPHSGFTEHSLSGRSARVHLPAGADTLEATANGGLVAVPVTVHGHERIVVIDGETGRTLRSVPFPDGDAGNVGVGTDGSLAVLDNGMGLLWYSPVGSDSFTELDAPQADDISPVVADGRIAYVELLPGLIDRPLVVSAGRVSHGQAAAHILFKGPVAPNVYSLAFSGTHVAWSTSTCQLMASVPGPSTNTIPAGGSCMRSEIQTIGYDAPDTTTTPRSLPVGAICTTAVIGTCDITAYAYDNTLLGSQSAKVKVGATDKIEVPLSAKAQAVYAANPDGVVFELKLSDGYGHVYWDLVP